MSDDATAPQSLADEPVEFAVDLGQGVEAPAWRVRSVVGVEVLGEGFSYELLLDIDGLPQPADAGAGTAVGFSMAALLGADAAIEWDEGRVRVGVVTEVERLRAHVPARSLEETVTLSRSTYRVVLAPRLHPTGLATRSRVLRDTTLDELFAQVCLDAGLTREEFSVSCGGTAGKRPVPFSIQYEESDLAFLTRWCERFGVWLRYDDDGAVALCDGPRPPPNKANFARLLRYDPSPSMNATSDSFYSIAVRREARPVDACVRLDDGHGTATIERHTAAIAGGSFGTTVAYSPRVGGGDGYGARVAAEMLAQRESVRAERYVGFSRARGLVAGDLVRLEGSPESALDGDYQLVRVRTQLVQRTDALPQAELFGDSPSRGGAPSHRVEFEAVRRGVQFRPALRTHVPTMGGVLIGVVTGAEPSNMAPVDENGRYRVVLPLHAGGALQPDTLEGVTAPVAMLMATGGSSRGMHIPLRTGTRVAVAFVRGDLDRPVLLGALPDGAATSRVVEDNSSAGLIYSSGSLIEIELEDNA